MAATDPSNDNKTEQKPHSLHDTLAQVEQSHLDLATIQAQGKAIADLAEMLDQAAQEDDTASHA